jgi:hypothetical protein
MLPYFETCSSWYPVQEIYYAGAFYSVEAFAGFCTSSNFLILRMSVRVGIYAWTANRSDETFEVEVTVACDDSVFAVVVLK